MTRLVLRRPRLVLLGAVLLTVLATALAGNVVERLSSGGFDAPGSESDRAAAALERLGVQEPNLVLLVRSNRAVDDPSVARAGAGLARRLAREPGVERVTSYWTAGTARLRGSSGRSALIEARLTGDENAVGDAARRLGERYRGRHGALEVGVAGLGPLIAETEDQIKRDLLKAELIVLPLTLVALFLVFGGWIAATLPLAIGAVSIVGTMLALRVISEFAPVSVFAVNLATALGLGLAIDYSLLIVGRYREELGRGLEPRAAIVATMATAGRTVLVSAVIVAISLGGLLVFPMYYLRSFAYAGVAVVAVAALGAVVLLPAMLAVFGRRIGRARSGGETGAWYRFARLAMRRPLPLATLGIVALLILGTPFLRASLGVVDDRNLPATAAVHQVSDRIRAEFPVRGDGTLFVYAPDGAPGMAYAHRLSRLDGVRAVEVGGPKWLAVQTDLEPVAPAAERLARAVRATPAPVPVQVAGLPAAIVDTKQALAARLPYALALIVVVTFAALFLLTGSVLAPLKALLLNTLSLTAAFGALVFIFQDGHLQWLVGDFTVTNSIAVLNPPLLFCVAFGLSMDYEVFMLSRIKEEHDRGRDDAEAIAVGLQRTGPIITAAAAVMAIVFLGFATSGVTGVKSLGVGLALAVLIDATLVRILLVPALMRMAGRLNWWPGLTGSASVSFATDAQLDVLRYGQVWEDHRLLERGLKVGPADDVLSIASAGDNVLALLLFEPRSIVALDVSPAQLALLELKLAALEWLSHGEFAGLLGACDGVDRLQLYARVRDGLGPRARAYWDAHPDVLSRGVLRAGMLERYFERFRAQHLAQLELEPLLDLDDRERQAERFERLLGTPEFEGAVRETFTAEAMSGQARDASQFRYVDADDAAGFFLRRLRHVCTQLPTRGNFHLEWFLTGRYRDLVAGPPFLQPANFDRLRALAGRVTIVEDELSSFLASQPEGSFSAANLSDVFEYLPEDATDELLSLLASRLRRGGRIAYWNLLVPRSADRVRGLASEPSRDLWQQDRVFFYQDFHLNTKP